MERKLIAAAVSSALALPMAAQAVEFSTSGHINRAVISVDGTGADSDGDLQHVDANSSQTRFRFTGSGELDSGMTAGVQLEYGLKTSLRHANVSLSSDAGKLTIGHGSMATDGMAHADLGGPSWLGGATNWCSYASTGPACPSNDGSRGPMLRYDTPAIGPAAIAFSVGNDDYWDVKLSISGSMGDAGYDLRIGHIGERDTSETELGSDEVLAMFDTRRVGGSDLLALLQSENMPEAGTANDFFNSDGTTIDTVSNQDASTAVEDHVAANDDVVAIDQLGTDTTVAESTFLKTTMIPGEDAVPDMMKEVKQGDITTASAAFSFGQGTSVALAWSQNNATDNEYQYIKLDHSYGDGSVAVYYKSGETGDVDGSHLGVAIGHSLGGGATAYAGFRQMSQDNMDDVDLLVAGLRVTFN